MKNFKMPFLFTFVLLFGGISCKNKSENTTQIHIETAVVNDSLKQAQGVVIDATMNGFLMLTPQNDTLYISTMDQEVALKGGLLLGDTLDVTYTVTDDEPGINIASTIKKTHFN